MGIYQIVKETVRHSALVHPGEGLTRAVAALVEYRRHCDAALRGDSAASQRTRAALGEVGCLLVLEAINIQIDLDKNSHRVDMGHGEGWLWWELLFDMSRAALQEADENTPAFAYSLKSAWETYGLLVDFYLWDRDAMIEEAVAMLNEQVSRRNEVQP